MALQVLHNNIRNVGKTLVMTGDFNIRNSNWDPNVHFHSIYMEDLIAIADSLDLDLASPINLGPTRFVDNYRDSNSVLDLVFIDPNNKGFNKHTLNPDIYLPSDHIPLIIDMGINDENIDIMIQAIKKDSKEEEAFIRDIIVNVRSIDTLNLKSQEDVQRCITLFTTAFKDT